MTRALLACVTAGLLAAAGCSPRNAESSGRAYKMGEVVRVGPLSYTVIDTEWLDQLGEGAAARLPQQRFLAVRLSVTNGSPRAADFPELALLDEQGNTHNEVNDGQGLSDWFGYLRTVQPNETQHGRVLFDLPAGTYRLRLSSDDRQATALVDIPFQLPVVIQPGDQK